MECTEESLPVMARYVGRFRSAQPSSRKEREERLRHFNAKNDFWWKASSVKDSPVLSPKKSSQSPSRNMNNNDGSTVIPEKKINTGEEVLRNVIPSLSWDEFHDQQHMVTSSLEQLERRANSIVEESKKKQTLMQKDSRGSVDENSDRLIAVSLDGVGCSSSNNSLFENNGPSFKGGLTDNDETTGSSFPADEDDILKGWRLKRHLITSKLKRTKVLPTEVTSTQKTLPESLTCGTVETKIGPSKQLLVPQLSSQISLLQEHLSLLENKLSLKSPVQERLVTKPPMEIPVLKQDVCTQTLCETSVQTTALGALDEASLTVARATSPFPPPCKDLEQAKCQQCNFPSLLSTSLNFTSVSDLMDAEAELEPENDHSKPCFQTKSCEKWLRQGSVYKKMDRKTEEMPQHTSRRESQTPLAHGFQLPRESVENAVPQFSNTKNINIPVDLALTPQYLEIVRRRLFDVQTISGDAFLDYLYAKKRSLFGRISHLSREISKRQEELLV